MRISDKLHREMWQWIKGGEFRKPDDFLWYNQKMIEPYYKEGYNVVVCTGSVWLLEREEATTEQKKAFAEYRCAICPMKWPLHPDIQHKKYAQDHCLMSILGTYYTYKTQLMGFWGVERDANCINAVESIRHSIKLECDRIIMLADSLNE